MSDGSGAERPSERRKQHPYDQLRAAWPLVWRVLTAVAVGFILAWLGERLLPTGEAAKRILARGYLPWLTATDQSPVVKLLPPALTERTTYPDIGQRQVAIVTIDDADLRALRLKWPPELGVYARLIDRLTPSKPRAIFLDFLLLDPRPEAEVVLLRDAVCRAARAGIPVLLAAIPGQRKSASPETLLREPQDVNGELRPCVSLVSPFTNEDPLDRASWEYPLCGEGLPSAALALACTRSTKAWATSAPPELCGWNREAHRCPSAAELPDLALVWPAKGSKHNLALLLEHADASSDDVLARRLPGYRSSCRTAVLDRQYLLPLAFALPRDWPPDWVTAAVPGFLRPILADDDTDSKALCPYSDLLPMRALYGYGLRAEQLTGLIEGRLLLIGANFIGQSDRQSAPLHDVVAGVQVHAMALDNLLSYGPAWRRAAEFDPARPLAPASLYAWVSVLLIVLGWELQQLLGGLATHLERRHAAPWSDWAFGRPRWLPAWLAGLKNLALAVLSLGRWPARRRGKLPFIALVGYIVLSLALWFSLIGVLFYVANAWLHVGPLSQVEYVLAPLALGFIDQGHRLARGAVLLWAGASSSRPAQFVREYREVRKDEAWEHTRRTRDFSQPAALDAAAPPGPAPSPPRTRS